MAEPFDFDAALAEIEIPTRAAIINGQTVQIKTALPLAAASYANKGDFLALLEAIMPADAAAYVAQRIPATKQGGELLNRFLRDDLGVDLGESDASAG